MVSYEQSICVQDNVTCKSLGNEKYAVYIESPNRQVEVRIWDSNTQEYIGKGNITLSDLTDLTHDSKHYQLSLNDGNVSVSYNPDGNNTSTFDNAGTSYESIIGSKNITALTIGGAVAAIVVGGAVLFFAKNHPVAGAAGVGTGEAIGGAAATEVVGSILNRLGSLLLPLLLGQNKADAALSSFKAAMSASMPVDPLVIDLDGDGIETTTLQNGYMMDYKNDGFAELTAWVGKDDGILVHDKNNNGVIDNGSELLGDNTLAA